MKNYQISPLLVYRSREIGQINQIFAILMLTVVAVAGSVYWKVQKDAAKALQQQQQHEEVKKNTEIERAQQELKALQLQIEASKATNALQTTLKAADDLYAKWEDAKKVAELTSRINLGAPVAAMQTLKREADALLVPDCLKAGKTALLDGMKLEIDGFLAFMSDANMGKLIALSSFSEATNFFTSYEVDRKMCPNTL